MLDKNKALVRRGFEEVWNQGRSEVIDELLADDAVIHGLVDGSGNPVQSPQAFYDFHAQFRGAWIACMDHRRRVCCIPITYITSNLVKYDESLFNLFWEQLAPLLAACVKISIKRTLQEYRLWHAARI